MTSTFRVLVEQEVLENGVQEFRQTERGSQSESRSYLLPHLIPAKCDCRSPKGHCVGFAQPVRTSGPQQPELLAAAVPLEAVARPAALAALGRDPLLVQHLVAVR